LGRNRDELLANIMQHGLMPMQGIWGANRPISSQPVGQVDFRAVCGVAKSAKAQALAWILRLAAHPENPLARPPVDHEQALTQLRKKLTAA
jgi:hypothetical protein